MKKKSYEGGHKSLFTVLRKILYVHTYYFLVRREGKSNETATFMITSTFNKVLGGIQQLRRPNFTQFWPPTPLEWTIVDILHNT